MPPKRISVSLSVWQTALGMCWHSVIGEISYCFYASELFAMLFNYLISLFFFPVSMPFPELQSFWKSRIIAFFSLYEFSLFTYLCFVRAILSYWYRERKTDIWIGKEEYTDWNLEGFFCPLPSLIPPTLMVSSGFTFPLCMFSLFLSPLMSIII